jgi:hypothetical protein
MLINSYPIVIDHVDQLLPIVIAHVDQLLPIVIDHVDQLLNDCYRSCDRLLPLVIAHADRLLPIVIDHVEGFLELLYLVLVEHGEHVARRSLGPLLGGAPTRGSLAGGHFLSARICLQIIINNLTIWASEAVKFHLKIRLVSCGFLLKIRLVSCGFLLKIRLVSCGFLLKTGVCCGILLKFSGLLSADFSDFFY